jgi:hypothetical protein
MASAQARFGAKVANPLLSALVAELGAANDVRVLAVKGLVANHFGIRPERVSADVDAVVDPRGLLTLAEAFGRCGWVERPTSDLARSLVAHSRSFIHPEWPSDVDLHGQYPGMLADPHVAFDALWSRRSTLTLAGRSVPATDFSGTVLVSALHSLRTWRESDRLPAEFEFLLSDVVPGLDETARADIVDLARALGALETARPLLGQLGVALPPSRLAGVDPRLDEWRARTNSGADRTAQLVLWTRKQPGGSRTRAVARALWQPTDEFLLDHPGHGTSRWRLLVGRVRRIGRGLLALPRALRSGPGSGPLDDSVIPWRESKSS